MIQVTIADAQKRLPELLAMVRAGEGMEIYADDGWVFRVGAVRKWGTNSSQPQYKLCQA